MLDDVRPLETASDRITLRFLAAPGDVSAAGNAVPAGRVLEWIDRAAYACAVGWSGSYAVTAYVGDVNFTHPIRPGELVEVHARIVLTGRSSMHILVSVECSDVRKRSFTPAMHCLLVMVAVDDAGAPQPVEPWRPWSDADLTLQNRARARIEPRAHIQRAMASAEYSQLGTAPRTVFRFLAAPSDVNWGGNVHGGTVMRWIDEAAFACAASWSTPDAVAVYAGGIQFSRPIHIGAIVEVDARLIHTSSRSMHVSVRVRSGATTSPHDLEQTTQCLSVFVAPDAGRARPIAQLPLVTPEDALLDAHARELIELRKDLAVIPSGLARYA
ncbi:acyl-CoA thioesterase [soil metagenome]